MAEDNMDYIKEIKIDARDVREKTFISDSVLNKLDENKILELVEDKKLYVIVGFNKTLSIHPVKEYVKMFMKEFSKKNSVV